VVGGEVALLKSLEETSGFVIAEMPIHVHMLFLTLTLRFASHIVSSCGLKWNICNAGVWDIMTVSIRFRSYYRNSGLTTPGSTSATLMVGITLWFLQSMSVGLIIRFQNNGIVIMYWEMETFSQLPTSFVCCCQQLLMEWRFTDKYCI
jgi:hypothetical protein